MMVAYRRPILVVESDPELLNAMRGLLRAEFELHTARSAREAMEILRRQPIHILVTDQRLPEMTGVEILRRVQTEWPDAIGVVLTTYCDLKAVLAATVQGGIFRYVTKPCDADELRAVLHLASEQYDQLADQRLLMACLHHHQAQCLALLEDLGEGRLGPLSLHGQAKVEQMAASASALLERLDGALVPEQSPAAASPLETATPCPDVSELPYRWPRVSHEEPLRPRANSLL